MDQLTTIHLTSDDALAYKSFMRHYDTIGYLVGYLDSLGLERMQNSQIVLDIDNSGVINHMAITKHFRK